MSLFRLRDRGNRYYANLGKYGGPSLKAMVPDGEHRATQDRDIAEDLYGRWKKYYLDGRKRRHLGLTKHVTLKKITEQYIDYRMSGGKIGRRRAKDSTLVKYAEQIDGVLIKHFKAKTPIGSITPADVSDFVKERSKQRSRKTGEPIMLSTIQRDLGILSSIFEYAIAQEIVYENPVRKAGWLELPDDEVTILEPPEAWSLLEAAAVDKYAPARALLSLWFLLRAPVERIDGAGAARHRSRA